MSPRLGHERSDTNEYQDINESNLIYRSPYETVRRQTLNESGVETPEVDSQIDLRFVTARQRITLDAA